jgi:hypothetical protein
MALSQSLLEAIESNPEAKQLALQKFGSLKALTEDAAETILSKVRSGLGSLKGKEPPPVVNEDVFPGFQKSPEAAQDVAGKGFVAQGERKALPPKPGVTDMVPYTGPKQEPIQIDPATGRPSTPRDTVQPDIGDENFSTFSNPPPNSQDVAGKGFVAQGERKALPPAATPAADVPYTSAPTEEAGRSLSLRQKVGLATTAAGLGASTQIGQDPAAPSQEEPKKAGELASTLSAATSTKSATPPTSVTPTSDTHETDTSPKQITPPVPTDKKGAPWRGFPLANVEESKPEAAKVATIKAAILKNPETAEQAIKDIQEKVKEDVGIVRKQFSPEISRLQQLAEQYSADYRQNKEKAEWGEVAERLGHAFAQLGAGYQGMKSGVDATSGLKFDKTDWAKKYDTLLSELKDGLSDVRQRTETQLGEQGRQEAAIGNRGKDLEAGAKEDVAAKNRAAQLRYTETQGLYNKQADLQQQVFDIEARGKEAEDAARRRGETEEKIARIHEETAKEVARIKVGAGEARQGAKDEKATKALQTKSDQALAGLTASLHSLAGGKSKDAAGTTKAIDKHMTTLGAELPPEVIQRAKEIAEDHSAINPWKPGAAKAATDAAAYLKEELKKVRGGVATSVSPAPASTSASTSPAAPASTKVYTMDQITAKLKQTGSSQSPEDYIKEHGLNVKR